ncbi:MAG: secretin N-terminal domain-containing protein [Candidatus Omnitrophota bacterium]
MIKHILKPKLILFIVVSLAVPVIFSKARAQSQEGAVASSDANAGAELPKPIIFTEPKEPLADRLMRKITLDVRDMNVVDVIKFLAQKGEFNVIISPTVDGRTTVLLHAVGIKDALDIVCVSNKLAYHIEGQIIQVMTAAEYEALYGKQFGDKTQVNIIHLQYSKPSYVLAALDNMKSNIGKIIIDEDTGTVVLVDTPQSIETMKKAIEQIERPLDTIVYDLKYAKADVVAEKLRSRIDAKAVGSITADERSNQVLVRVFPGRHDEVEKIIRRLDVATKEVLIEARVMEIFLKPTYDLGIDWSSVIKNGNKPVTFENINGATGGNLAGNFGSVAVGNIGIGDFAAAVRSLQQVRDTKNLSSPQILVNNNEEAKIHIGDTVPYLVSTTNGTGDTAVTSDDVRFIDIGLKLNVIPTINDDGMVTMRLRPEISSISGTVTSHNPGTAANPQGSIRSQIPQVNKTEVETSVMVKDGMTIILAGLRKEEKTHTKNGVPGLMDVPLLGHLFSKTTDAITSTEIVILITPHIVKGTEDYTKVLGTIKPAKKYDETFKVKEPVKNANQPPAK